MHMLALALMGGALLLAIVAVSPAQGCGFDTDDDGTIDLSAPDVDGDGFCDFPDVVCRYSPAGNVTAVVIGKRVVGRPYRPPS